MGFKTYQKKKNLRKIKKGWMLWGCQLISSIVIMSLNLQIVKSQILSLWKIWWTKNDRAQSFNSQKKTLENHSSMTYRVQIRIDSSYSRIFLTPIVNTTLNPSQILGNWSTDPNPLLEHNISQIVIWCMIVIKEIFRKRPRWISQSPKASIIIRIWLQEQSSRTNFETLLPMSP